MMEQKKGHDSMIQINNPWNAKSPEIVIEKNLDEFGDKSSRFFKLIIINGYTAWT